MVTFEKGSEWRKWDLHVHTKDTNKNDQFKSATFDDFCVSMFRKTLEKEIKSIGVTDYFCINNFKRVIKFVEKIESCSFFDENEKEDIKNLLILPNVELRMLPSTGSGNLINIHCIFNPEPDFLSSLENDFFGSLENSNGCKMNRQGMISLGQKKNSQLSGDAAYREGVNSFHIEPSSLIKIFKEKPKLKKNTIIIVSNSSTDGASALQEHYKLFENEPGLLDAVRKDIYTLSDAIFSGNPKDRMFFLGKKEGYNEDSVINSCGSLKPCIHGSDAHCEDDLFTPDKNRFCWIKADLTFEGFKQTLCEPQDRVIIQPNKPEEKSGYHVIKSIEIDNDICKQKILLNPNLNTIIGGRSTGKSTLLKLIAYGVDPNIIKNDKFITGIPQDTIKIIWQDDEEDAGRDINFYPQNHMHEIASDEGKKNRLIQGIVEEKDIGNHIVNYKNFCSSNKNTIQTNVDNLFKLQGNLNELTVSLKEKGDESGIKKEISSLEERIKSSHENKKFTEDDLEKFEDVNKEIINTEQLLKRLEEDKREINRLKIENLFNTSFSYELNKLSEENCKALSLIFTEIKEEATKKWENRLSEKLKEIDVTIEAHKDSIKKKNDSDIFKRGSSHLEENKQYRELNDRLAIERKRLSEIEAIQKNITAILEQKQSLFDETVENHVSYRTKIDELICDFSLTHDDIEIKIEKTYLENKCKELLRSSINLQSYERQNFVDGWGNSYQSNIKSKIEDFLQQALDKRIELKSLKDIKDLTKSLLTENWFSISYELTYQNDTFEKMSDGKKAFVILKLLLEFSNKECPILIDQPEDSLDNRAIYNELVTYLKKKKKSRQVILVTHNANIVVNADTEEVIVSNQHGEDSKNQGGIKFQYVSGSLEATFPKNKDEDRVLQSQGIREHVCEILEGGTEAFKKREHKYSIG